MAKINITKHGLPYPKYVPVGLVSGIIRWKESTFKYKN